MGPRKASRFTFFVGQPHAQSPLETPVTLAGCDVLKGAMRPFDLGAVGCLASTMIDGMLLPIRRDPISRSRRIFSDWPAGAVIHGGLQRPILERRNSD
jgi:hypothetical protein